MFPNSLLGGLLGKFWPRSYTFQSYLMSNSANTPEKPQHDRTSIYSAQSLCTDFSWGWIPGEIQPQGTLPTHLSENVKNFDMSSPNQSNARCKRSQGSSETNNICSFKYFYSQHFNFFLEEFRFSFCKLSSTALSNLRSKALNRAASFLSPQWGHSVPFPSR